MIIFFSADRSYPSRLCVCVYVCVCPLPRVRSAGESDEALASKSLGPGSRGGSGGCERGRATGHSSRCRGRV